ncbi:MAG: peptidase [Sphingobacteriaceae bacterium]|nr:MAG: peptidase [Sphingobacteriaceae bacterium]
MTKTFYTVGVLFLGLTLVSSFFQNVMYLRVGPQILSLESFLPWFFTASFVFVTGSLIILKYHHYKRFWSAFYTGIVFTVANLCRFVVFSCMLLTGKLIGLNVPTYIFILLASSLYGISLLFSNAGRRFWLKASGLLMLITSLILISMFLEVTFFLNIQLAGKLEKIRQWISLLYGLFPALFMINFVGELRLSKQENIRTTSQKPLESLLAIVGVLAFIQMLVLGTSLISENSTTLYWQNYNANKAQQLVELAGGAKTYVNSKNDSLHYILIKPMDYDPKKEYPLVVCLPYGGYEASGAEFLSNDTNRVKHRAFIFVPNCPAGSGWGGIPNYPSIDTLVYKAISTLDKEPGIDTKRRYVTGVSRGGYGSWNFICSRPDMFAAAIPVSGGGDPKFASKIVNVAIWAFHGAKDRNVPVSGSRDMIEAIKKAGGNPKYTEYPNEAHNIWSRVSSTPGLIDWLFAQKRD